MHLLTLAVAVVLVAIILQELLVWHLQIARAMLSFLVAAAAPVATIHQARVVWLTDLIQIKFDTEAVRAERARQKIKAEQVALSKSVIS